MNSILQKPSLIAIAAVLSAGLFSLVSGHPLYAATPLSTAITQPINNATTFVQNLITPVQPTVAPAQSAAPSGSAVPTPSPTPAPAPVSSPQTPAVTSATNETDDTGDDDTSAIDTTATTDESTDPITTNSVARPLPGNQSVGPTMGVSYGTGKLSMKSTDFLYMIAIGAALGGIILYMIANSPRKSHKHNDNSSHLNIKPSH